MRRAQVAVVAVVVLLGLAAAPAHAAPHATAAGSSCSAVRVGPAAAAEGARSYFDLRVLNGGSARAGLLVSNPATSSCAVRLHPASGRTATNSGDTYAAASSDAPCSRTACWIAGLPDRVVVPARGHRVVPFLVSVPAGGTPGQYLAGVIAEPQSDRAAAQGSSQVQVRVRSRVAVGVAVTVPGALRAEVVIPTVRVVAPRTGGRTVDLLERNTGNTWEHPHGTLAVQVNGRTARIPLTSRTLLAGDEATLSIGADGVAEGAHPARAVLHYGHGRTAIWSGTLVFHGAAAAHDGSGRIVVTAEVIPPWVVALLVAGGLALLAALVLLALLLRRRWRDGAVAVA